MTEEKATDQTEIVEAGTTTEVETFHNPDKLFRVAIWSNWIAWILLVMGLANLGYRIYSSYAPYFQSGQADFSNTFYIIATEGYYIFFILFGFTVLHGLSQVIYMLMDIYNKE